MPDALFADSLLARVYDAFDGPRDDLPHYVGLLAELGARSVLDLGCGTGSLAVLLPPNDVAVVAVDPAAASLEVARRKPGADAVNWVCGTAESVIGLGLTVDAAVMTGNVAQVFVSDDEWAATLGALHRLNRPHGHLVFETRRLEARAWVEWASAGPEMLEVPGVGSVRRQLTVTEVALPLVSFRYDYEFGDGTRRSSESTLRFRDVPELRKTLLDNGFQVEEIREAPDRPGREHVVIAQRMTARALPLPSGTVRIA